ncbi:MAG: glycosyltransferase family 39 protein [Candidatus Daviesbacteria bacterium]|nr:glycosyltransferase family 39 protein [Candidatus Daviesbacteria bacterium]
MIWFILFLALVLRLVNINQSLWWDEAINVVYARSSELWWFITKYPVGDFHPPGWFAVLWVWGHIFGFAEISVRLPSVILGTATVWLTYLLGKEIFNKKIGLLSALFMAIAPLHVYYSQEARMYVLAAFVVTLSFYFLHRLTTGKKWAWLGFIISLVLVLYSDYLAYLIIPAQIIYLIWTKKMRREALMVFLAPVVIFLPWLTIFPAQFKTGIDTAFDLPGWANVVGSNFKDLILFPVKFLFGRVTLSDKSLYAGIAMFAGAVFGGVLLSGIKKVDHATKLLICWIFIPLILAFLVSFFIPVLAYFRMIFLLPPVYLFLAKGIYSLPKKIAVPAFMFICLVSVLSLGMYYFNPKFQREDWKGAASFVSRNLDNQTLVVFENNEIPASVKYYASDLSNFEPALSPGFEKKLINKNKIFLFEYLADIYDSNRIVERKLRDFNFSETKIYNFHGVGFIREYHKL